jgi:hypothetical protein
MCAAMPNPPTCPARLRRFQAAGESALSTISSTVAKSLRRGWLEVIEKIGRGEWLRTTELLVPNSDVRHPPASAASRFLHFRNANRPGNPPHSPAYDLVAVQMAVRHGSAKMHPAPVSRGHLTNRPSGGWRVRSSASAKGADRSSLRRPGCQLPAAARRPRQCTFQIELTSAPASGNRTYVLASTIATGWRTAWVESGRTRSTRENGPMIGARTLR